MVGTSVSGKETGIMKTAALGYVAKVLAGGALLAGLAGIGGLGSAQAAIVVNPTAVSGTGNWQSAYPFFLSYAIDGWGLSDDTVVENGDTVPVTWPTCNTVSGARAPLPPSLPKTVTFTLDKLYTLDGLCLWNYSEYWQGNYYNTRGVKGTSIAFSTDGGANFGSPVALSDFVAAESATWGSAQYKAFTPAEANAVRLTVTSNLGDTGFVGFNEIRFTGFVPEPTSLALLALAGAAMLRRRQRA